MKGRKKALQRRYQMYALIFAVVWTIGFLRLRQSDTDTLRDSADALLQDAQPVSAFESVVVGNTVTLTGGLAFVEQRAYPNYRVARLDFATQTVSSAFDIPDGALVYQIAATPDPDTLLMTYSPSEVHYDRNGLYTLSLSDGTLTRIIGGETAATYYAHPQWSGDFITYGVYERESQARRIERYDLLTGVVSVLVNDAVMPLASPDGDNLAYLRVEPTTGARSLWMSAMDGSAAREVVSEGDFADIDLPTFSPDGAWVYFTVLEPQPVASRALEIVFGATPTQAHGNHNLPMRWYRVGIDGGAPQLVTSDPFITFYGGLNAAETLGFVSDTGFYVAQAGRIEQVIQSRVMRSFVWLGEGA